MGKLRLRRGEGFSLVELLVTVVIIAVLAAIAIPLYTSQKNKAALAAAQTDVRAAGEELLSVFYDYTSLGTAGVTMTYASPSLTIPALTSPAGGTASSQTVTLRVSPGTTLVGYTHPGDTRFCLVATNNSQKAIWDETGLRTTMTGCVTSGGTMGTAS